MRDIDIIPISYRDNQSKTVIESLQVGAQRQFKETIKGGTDRQKHTLSLINKLNLDHVFQTFTTYPQKRLLMKFSNFIFLIK